MNLWNNRNFTPMLLSEINKPFDSKDYIFEIKFDGIRALIFVSPNEFKIISRNKKDITYLYPELKEIQKLVKKNTIFDGEIIVMEENGPSFSKLQERSHLKSKDKIKIQSNNNPVMFVSFDILYQDKDLTNIPLLKRKEFLNKIKENDFFIKSKYFNNNGIKLFNTIKRKNLEGIVAKRIDTPYELNTRSKNWIKIKNFKEEEFYICGYEKKKNGISALIGELKDNNLFYVGNVGVTNNLPLYKDILKMKKLKKSPFIDYNNNKIYFIEPKLKCVVKYMERTKRNHLRQPVIKR